MPLALKYYAKPAGLTKDLPHILSVDGYQQKALLEKYDAADAIVLAEFRAELEQAYASELTTNAHEALWKKAHETGVESAGTKYAFLDIEKEYKLLVEFLKEATQ